MYDTVDYIKNFNFLIANDLVSQFPGNLPLILTGEGSSRIFPAKNAVHHRLLQDKGPLVFTESSTDLRGKNLKDFIVIGASNSGKTKELVNLFRQLKKCGHQHLYGLSCNHNSLLEECSHKTLVIDAGIEKAVAASKSVIAQALFYEAIIKGWNDQRELDTRLLSDSFKETLDILPAKSLIELVCKSEMIYFAGNNNGVAEELTLKTNEIIRKKSAFLPGTYMLHGVEEVISKNDIIILVDTYPDEYKKIKSIYSDSIGTPVVAFSTEPTPFNTLIIPSVPPVYESYIKIAAGWNLLVESGIELNIDIDKPQRARKVGNEADEITG